LAKAKDAKLLGLPDNADGCQATERLFFVAVLLKRGGFEKQQSSSYRGF